MKNVPVLTSKKEQCQGEKKALHHADEVLRELVVEMAPSLNKFSVLISWNLLLHACQLAFVQSSLFKMLNYTLKNPKLSCDKVPLKVVFLARVSMNMENFFSQMNNLGIGHL